MTFVSNQENVGVCVCVPCVCVWIHTHKNTKVCMSRYIYIYIYIHTQTHTYRKLCMLIMFRLLSICIHIHAQVHTHLSIADCLKVPWMPRMHIPPHTCTDAHLPIYCGLPQSSFNASIDSFARVLSACVHACMYTYVYVCIHIYPYVCVCAPYFSQHVCMDVCICTLPCEYTSLHGMCMHALNVNLCIHTWLFCEHACMFVVKHLQ
jgi:hypothetical protein